MSDRPVSDRAHFVPPRFSTSSLDSSANLASEKVPRRVAQGYPSAGRGAEAKALGDGPTARRARPFARRPGFRGCRR